jgi:pilus assembly protein Flp/PilA
MKALVARFVREESGQDLIEYGLLVGVVTAVSAATVTAIGTKVKGWFDALKTAINA